MDNKYYYLNPGYIFYSEEHYIIETVLGSCISVCIWDTKRKTGGINHFIFPDGDNIKENNGKYGKNSTIKLIKIILESGSRKEDLRASIAGGANNRLIKLDIGERNVKTAKEILKKFGISVIEEWTGGYTGRKLTFDNNTGVVNVYLLKEQGEETNENTGS